MATQQQLNEAFMQKRAALLSFIEENRQLYDIYLRLVNDYNQAVATMEHHLRTMQTAERIVAGPFMRTAVSKTKVYNPLRLPAMVLGSPGVVKSVDAKAVDDLITTGKITADMVAGALEWKETTAKIHKPPQIEVNL